MEKQTNWLELTLSKITKKEEKKTETNLTVKELQLKSHTNTK